MESYQNRIRIIRLSLLIVLALFIQKFSFAQNALTFDGVDQFVSFDYVTYFDNNEKDFSVEVWFNSAGSSTASIYSIGTNSPNNAFSIRQGPTNLLEINTPDGVLVQSASTINDAQWHHAALVYEGGAVSLYLDAELEGSVAYTLILDGSFAELARNSMAGDEYWNGDIDELRIWGKSLTEKEILANIFNYLDAYNYFDLKNYYTFDQFPTETTLNDDTYDANGFMQNMDGTEWVASTAQDVQYIASTGGGGAFSSAASWNGGVVPGRLNGINILVGDSVYLDADLDLAAITIDVGGAFSQQGFNTSLFSEFNAYGNYWGNPNDTLFIYGSSVQIDPGSNLLPQIYVENGAVLEQYSPVYTWGGVFIDSAAVYSGGYYSTSLVGNANWFGYGFYENYDSLYFLGSNQTILEDTIGTLTLGTGSLTLLGDLKTDRVLASGIGSELHLQNYSMTISNDWSTFLLDTMTWDPGAKIIFDDYLSSFQTDYNPVGDSSLYYPSVEILNGAFVDINSGNGLLIAPNETITIFDGELLAYDNGTIILGDLANIEINGGAFYLEDGGYLAAGDGSQIINNGGILRVGIPYDPAGESSGPTEVFAAEPATSYEIIQNSGELEIQNTTFHDLGGDGIAINGGTIIKAFNVCNFKDGVGTAYITINDGALDGFAMDSVGFFAGPTYNISKTASSGSGTVTVNQGFGDFSGPLNDDIQAGSIQWLNEIGDLDYALAFDGFDDYVTFATSPVFGDSITLETWIKHNGADGDIAYWDFGGGAYASISLVSGQLWFYNDDGAAQSGAVNSSYTIPADQWVHIAVVIYFQNNVAFYINGNQTNTGSSAAVAGGAGTFTMSFSGDEIEATFDEFRIWSDDLTQSDIEFLIDSTLTGGEPNLEAYYQFTTSDPLSDINLVDLTSNSHDGVLQNFDFDGETSGWVVADAQQPVQQALNFGGVDEYVDVASGADYPTNLTIEAWVLPDSTNNERVIASWDFDTAPNARFQISNGFLSFVGENGPGSFNNSLDSVEIGRWQHVAVTKAGTALEFFINGQSVGTETLTVEPSGSNNFVVGAYENGAGYASFFDGNIDELRVWDAVVPANVMQQYALTEDLSGHPNSGNLRAHYSFNDGTVAGGTNPADTFLIDKSGSGFDGILQGTWPMSGTSSNWIASKAFDGAFPVVYRNGNLVELNGIDLPSSVTGTYFGPVIESDSLVRDFILTNEGLDTLIISDLVADGAMYSAYVDQQVLNPGDSTNLSIVFAPEYAGTHNANINIYYGGQLGTFQVQGIGYPSDNGPGTAVNFNGSDNYVELDNVPTYDLAATDPFSFETWVYMYDTVGTMHIFGTEFVSSSNPGFQFQLVSGKPELKLVSSILGPNQIQVQSNEVIDTTTWYHLAVTYDGSETAAGVTLYINGVVVPTTTLYDNISGSIQGTDPTTFGARNGSFNWFNGKIDEFRLWSTERTATEVANNLFEVLEVSEPGLEAYFPFNLGAGTTVYDLVNGNNGTHYGSPTVFVSSEATINSDEKFDPYFDKNAVWEEVSIRYSSNMAIQNTGFADDDGDNVFFAHDNMTAGDEEYIATDLGGINSIVNRRLNRTWYTEFYDGSGNFGGDILFLFDNINYDSTKTYYLLERVSESPEFEIAEVYGLGQIDDTVAFVTNSNDLYGGETFYTLGVSESYPGYALALDGVDDSVRIEGLSIDDSFSIEFWGRFNQPSPDEDGILAFRTADYIQVLIDTDGSLLVDVFGGGNQEKLKGSIDINDDVWHNIAITRDNSNFRIFVDGIEDTGTSYVIGSQGIVSAVPFSGDFIIGNNNTLSNPCGGIIDELRIWDNVRDSAAIAENFIYPVNISSPGLVAYHKFDQLYTYQRAVDQAANTEIESGELFNFSDTPTSGYVISDGFGIATEENALSFDGADDFVSVPNLPIYDVSTTGDFSIEAWINGGVNTNGAGIVTLGTTAPLRGIGLVVSDGYLGVEIGNAISLITPAEDTLRSSTRIDDNQWHHVAVVANRSFQSITIYIDGIREVYFEDPIVAEDLTSGVFNIGTNYTGTINYNGMIDEVKYWSKQLNESNIRQYMFEEVYNNENELEAYFNFNQGESGVDNTGISTLNDESNNFNDATLNNFGLTGVTSNFITSDAFDSLRSRLKIIDEYGDIVEDGIVYDMGIEFEGDSTSSWFIVTNAGKAQLDISTFDLGNPQAVFERPLSNFNLASFETDTVIVRLEAVVPTNSTTLDVSSNDPESPYSTTMEVTGYPLLPGAGDAISLDGNADNYLVSSSTDADLSHGWTVEFWAHRLNETTNDYVFSQGDGTPGEHLNIGFPTGTNVLLGFGGDELTVDYGTLTSDWNHWAFTYDSVSGEQRILLNGVEIGNRISSGPYGATGGFIYVGRNSVGGDEFAGDIDELRVWEGPLPDSIIRQHLATTLTGESENVEGIAVYFRFDEGSGTDVVDLTGEFDFTINGGTRVQSGAHIGKKSLYTYSEFELTTGPAGERIEISNISDPSGGAHIYLIESTPDPDTLSGFDNITDTTYYGVFAPTSTFDLGIQYIPVPGEDSLRILRRDEFTDTSWEPISGLFDTDAVVDSIQVANQETGQFTIARSLYPTNLDAGDALDFDGLDDYVTLGAIPALQDSGAHTIEAWISTTGITGFIAGRADDNTAAGYGSGLQLDGSGNVEFIVSNGSLFQSVVSTIPINDGGWYHVAGVYVPGDSLNLFINGVLDASNTTAIETLLNSASLFWNSGSISGTTDFFTGQLDEVRFWDTSLSGDAIFNHAFAPLNNAHPFVDDLVLYQKFDDGTGSDILVDVKSNFTGALINMDSGTDWVPSGAFELPPLIPTVDSLITNSLEPLITGTHEFGPDFEISIDTLVFTLGVDAELSVDSLGIWQLDLTGSPLPGDGIYDVIATSTDPVNLLSSTDTTINELTVDTTLPDTPTVDTLVTNDQMPLITGTFEYGTILQVDIDTLGYTLGVDPELSTDSISVWTLDLSGGPMLSEGIYDVMVVSTDSSGNVASDVQTDELTIDITPAVVTFDVLTTPDFSPELTGTIDDTLAIVTVHLDDSTYQVTINPDSTWILADNTISPDLSPGLYDVVMTATDLAGNITIDTTFDGLTIGGVPLAYEAINVNAFDFVANWQEFSGLTGYALDVAEDSTFTQFVSGYENFVTTDSAETITGVNYSSQYYYRVRSIITPGDTSDYSNTISVYTSILTGTIADSTALMRLYDSTGGPEWNTPVNWGAERLDNWNNIIVNAGRVIEVDLSANNLVGSFPSVSGEELDSLETLLLGDNDLESISDLSALPVLTNLEVQNNALTFESLELLAGIGGVYTPQDSLLNKLIVLENEGDDVTLERIAAGTSNTYQWYRDGVELSGETSNSLTIADVTFADEGKYYVEVQNTIATGITLISNTINLKVSSIERDTTALRAIYEALDGPSWTKGSNWFSNEQIGDWDGVGTDGSRITSLDLSSSNVEGVVPEDILDIINLSNINFSNNLQPGNKGLTGMPDFSGMPNLTTLNVSGNSLQFGAIEPTVGNVDNFTYNNQAQIGNQSSAKIRKGTRKVFSVSVTGENNIYDWRLNGTSITGADSSVYVVESLDYNSMGTYSCVITNSVATDLTITNKEQTVLAFVDLEGTVTGDGSPISSGSVIGLKIVPGQTAFDTIPGATISNGDFELRRVILGDYIVAAEADDDDYLPTYYSSTELWAQADTLIVRDTIPNFEIALVGVPPELTPADGDGGIGGYMEDELESSGGRVTNGKLETGRRVRRAGVMLRRRPPTSKSDDDDGFVLIAYVQTDDNGEFTFENLPSGTYRINFEYPGVPMDPDSFIEFELGADGSEDTYSLQAVVTEDGIVVTPLDLTRVFKEYFTDLEVYPNPARGRLFITYSRLNNNNVSVLISDVAGNTMMSTMLTPGLNGEIEMNVGELSQGIYLLQFIDSDQDKLIGSAKFIKN